MPRAARITAIFPVLPARDITTAVPFFVGKLGFSVGFGDPGQADGYVGLRRDGVEIHLQFQFEKDFQAGTAGLACLRFEVDDPDALYQAWLEAGALEQSTALRDTPWGTREFSMRDPNGNTLTFQRDL